MLKVPFVDRIWTAEGSVPIDPPRPPAEVFARLNVLLEPSGTTLRIDRNTLSYTKDNPAAQDKLATFSRGTLHVFEEQGKSRLRYKLTSPALLLCFLAPLLFLGFAQATIFITNLERPAQDERSVAEAEEEDDKEPEPLNFIDQALGAPAPETLEEKKAREEAEGEEEESKHSPRPAYVFAGIFAALYFIGRMLEPWLVRKTFRKALREPETLPTSD